MNNNEYRVGVNRGLPVGMGYFSVSFGFGAMAVSQGLKTLDAVLLDAPCSYITSVISPQGSTKMGWRSLPAKRTTLSSMEGQYRGPTPSIMPP